MWNFKKLFLAFFVLVHFLLFIFGFLRFGSPGLGFLQDGFSDFGFLGAIFNFPSFLLWINAVICIKILKYNYIPKRTGRKIISNVILLTMCWLVLGVFFATNGYNKFFQHANVYTLSGRLDSHDTYIFDYDWQGHAKKRGGGYKPGPGWNVPFLDLEINNGENRVGFVCGTYRTIYCWDFLGNQKGNEATVYFHKIPWGKGYANKIVRVESSGGVFDFLSVYRRDFCSEIAILSVLICLYIVYFFIFRSI